MMTLIKRVAAWICYMVAMVTVPLVGWFFGGLVGLAIMIAAETVVALAIYLALSLIDKQSNTWI